MIYIEIKNDKPIRATHDERIASHYDNMITTYYADYSLYNIKYIYDVVNNSIIINPHYDADMQKKEEDRINNLIMTALDFIAVLENFGLDYVNDIVPFLTSHPDLDKQLKYCQNVYCGVVKAQCPIKIKEDITITAKMIEEAFKSKHGEN